MNIKRATECSLSFKVLLPIIPKVWFLWVWTYLVIFTLGCIFIGSWLRFILKLVKIFLLNLHANCQLYSNAQSSSARHFFWLQSLAVVGMPSPKNLSTLWLNYHCNKGNIFVTCVCYPIPGIIYQEFDLLELKFQ